MLLQEFIERAYPNCDLSTVEGLDEKPPNADDGGPVLSEEAQRKQRHKQVCACVCVCARAGVWKHTNGTTCPPAPPLSHRPTPPPSLNRHRPPPPPSLTAPPL